MKNRERQKGSVIVEFSIAATIMLLLMCGIVQIGYAFLGYERLTNAVHAGARYASIRTYDSASSTPSSSFSTAVKNVVIYGDPGGTGIPVMPGLTASNIDLTVVFINNIPNQVKVSIVNYQLGAYAVNNKPFAIFPYVGRSSKTL